MQTRGSDIYVVTGRMVRWHPDSGAPTLQLSSNGCAQLILGNGIQPKVFLTDVFGNPLAYSNNRAVDVRAFGSWMSAPKCFFSRMFTALTEVFGRDIRANDPRMSAGYPSPKLPLWADFSFLRFRKLEKAAAVSEI